MPGGPVSTPGARSGLALTPPPGAPILFVEFVATFVRSSVVVVNTCTFAIFFRFDSSSTLLKTESPLWHCAAGALSS